MEEIYWECFFNNAGINGMTSKEYSLIFVKNKISDTLLTHINESYLKSMGIEAIGDIIRIMKYAKDFLTEKNIPPRIIKETNDFTEQFLKISPTTEQSDSNKEISKKLSITSYNKSSGCELPISITRAVTPEIETQCKIKYPIKSRVVTLEPESSKTDLISTSQRTVILNDSPEFNFHNKISVLNRLGHSKEKYILTSNSDDDEYGTTMRKSNKRKQEIGGNLISYNRFVDENISKDMSIHFSREIRSSEKIKERNVFSRLGDISRDESLEINRFNINYRLMSQMPNSEKRVKVRIGNTTEHLQKMEATSTTEMGSLRSDSYIPRYNNVLNRLGHK